MNKSILLFVLFALFAAAFVSAHGGQEKTPEEKAAEEALFNPPNSDVITATAESIDEVLGKAEFALVEFYAPWCPHCKQLVPTYEKVATALKEKGISVVKVDCDKHREVAQKYNVPGFPTIKLFKNGKAFKDFEEADRSVEGILRWIEKKTGPAATTLASEDDVAAFVKKQTDNGVTSAVVVGIFPSKEAEEYKTFLATADSVDDFVFAEVVAEGKPVQVKLYKAHQGEEDVTVGADALKSAEALTAEVKANGYSLVDEVNGKTFQRYAASKLPLGVLFFDYTKADQKESGLAVLRPAAKALRGKFNFGYSDAAVYGEQYAIMGGDKTKLPGLAAMNLETRKNFPYTGELNAEDVTAWANQILEGKIQPFMRSEPIPEKNDEPVKIVVGKNYEQLVMDETKDVLLEFYAPWCGHCQKLAPKYEQLAEFFAPVKDLVIAKVDATQNDTPVSVEGFPTIYYFPADGKDEPIQYEGNRSIQDLKKFIKKNASDRISSQVKDLLKNEKGDKKDKKADKKKSKDEL